MIENFYVKFGGLGESIFRYRAEKQTDKQTNKHRWKPYPIDYRRRG